VARVVRSPVEEVPLSRPPSTPTARRIVESYDAVFRAGLTVPPDLADDPEALAAAAAALPDAAAQLLETLAIDVETDHPSRQRGARACAAPRGGESRRQRQAHIAKPD
jgi:hypothetical protein